MDSDAPSFASAWAVDRALGADRLLGLPPWFVELPRVVVEAPAEAQVLERIRALEDHFGAGRLPYWLRYYSRILQAEYEVRMDEVRRTIQTLDAQARSHLALQQFFGTIR